MLKFIGNKQKLFLTSSEDKIGQDTRQIEEGYAALYCAYPGRAGWGGGETDGRYGRKEGGGEDVLSVRVSL
jgi:hypothetical protein